MKKQRIEYAVFNENGDFLDVLNLTKKEAREYERDNPDQSLEELDEIDLTDDKEDE
jgi:hypothetical protein